MIRYSRESKKTRDDYEKVFKSSIGKVNKHEKYTN